MTNTIINAKALHLFFAIAVAILTTGFLRLQLASGMPEIDGGFYTFGSQYIYYTLINGEALKGTPLFLYQFMTSWVYAFELNQIILLRLIDGLVAIFASIVLFKVILKESDNTLFTVILVSGLLIIMNDIEIITYGFRNSIWASFLPLFSALLIWQHSTKSDKYSFYLIGGLISLGILLREPFLPFFLLASIAIFIGYGWRPLIKYLVGSAFLGFSLLGFMLMLRGWDLIDLINSYTRFSSGVAEQQWKLPITIIKINWFIFVTASISIIYLIKLYFSDKKSVSMNRVYFWIAAALIPIIEYYSKLGLHYHFSNCLIGFAGLSAMGWKYVNIHESKKIKSSSMVLIALLSLLLILLTFNKKFKQEPRIFSLSDSIQWVKTPHAFRSKDSIDRSQFSAVAAKAYEYSREDSTLAVGGYWQGIYPLTGLLPPSANKAMGQYPPFLLSALKGVFASLDNDKDKQVEILKHYRPTIIIASTINWDGKTYVPEIIEATNLYEIVAIIPAKFSYRDFYVTREIQKLKPGIDPSGWMQAAIYRLKDFK